MRRSLAPLAASSLLLLVACDVPFHGDEPGRAKDGAGVGSSMAFKVTGSVDGSSHSKVHPSADPVPVPIADQLLREQVLQAIKSDGGLARTRVEVQVVGGVVSLGGFVGDQVYAERAHDLVGQIPGVTAVKNEIVVRLQVPERTR